MQARERLEEVLDELAARYRDDLAPAIDRVWDDSIDLIRADAREWLARLAADPDWTPWRFELSFGLGGRDRLSDEHSVAEPVRLDCGIRLRGSIDLVEQASEGRVRATDYKTGKPWVKQDAVIDGGKALQPVLYALALEKLVPGSDVESGRLHYCTARGSFSEVVIPLDTFARAAADRVAKTVGEALSEPFLPAAPEKRGCTYCDYKTVCGNAEEFRVTRKPQIRLAALKQLREMS